MDRKMSNDFKFEIGQMVNSLNYALCEHNSTMGAKELYQYWKRYELEQYIMNEVHKFGNRSKYNSESNLVTKVNYDKDIQYLMVELRIFINDKIYEDIINLSFLLQYIDTLLNKYIL
tara:strand:- start:3234 stop:3584 length:351 start_codon:yes stop_codon:yes gene_type:complete